MPNILHTARIELSCDAYAQWNKCDGIFQAWRINENLFLNSTAGICAMEILAVCRMFVP